MKFRLEHWRILVLCVVVALAAAVAVSAGQASRGAKKLTTINIGVVALSDYAPIYIAQKYRLFAKHGLSVNITSVASSSGLLPLLVNGTLQFATATPANEFGPVVNGIPIKFVSSTDTGKINVPPLVAVGPNTGIKTMKQTTGKTFCLPAVGSGSQLNIEAWAEKAGVDPTTLKFTVAPNAAMVAAIQSGKCDGALIPSPFYEIGKAAGFINLGNPFFAFGGVGVPVGSVVTLGTYSSAHASTVKAFIAAMTDAVRYAGAHPKAVRALLPTYAGITQEQANAVILPLYTTKLPLKALQKEADYAAKIHFINGTVNVRTQMLAPGAPTVNR